MDNRLHVVDVLVGRLLAFGRRRRRRPEPVMRPLAERVEERDHAGQHDDEEDALGGREHLQHRIHPEATERGNYKNPICLYFHLNEQCYRLSNSFCAIMITKCI